MTLYDLFVGYTIFPKIQWISLIPLSPKTLQRSAMETAIIERPETSTELTVKKQTSALVVNHCVAFIRRPN